MEGDERRGCFFENRIYPEGSKICDLNGCRVCKNGIWVDQGEKTGIV